MAKTVGVNIPASTIKRMQVATKEHDDGTIDVDRVLAAEALVYIKEQLALKRPVCCGFNYRLGSGNRDGITDHFMLVIGMNEMDQFICQDPGRSACIVGYNAILAALPDGKVLRIDPARPRMWLSMVVPRSATEGSEN
jgi:hypothetical protein